MSYDFSIVVPVYDLESEIIIFDKNIRENLLGLGYNYKLIYINDCSSDDSLNNLNVVKKDNTLIINNEKNIGQHLSLYEGLKYVEGNFVIIMDGDNQSNPKAIKELIEIYNNNNNTIVHVLFKENITRYHKLISNFFYLLIYLVFGIKKEEVAHSFKLIPIFLVNKIMETNKKYAAIFFHFYLLSKKFNYQHAFVWSKKEKRVGIKQTSYSNKKLLILLFKVLYELLEHYYVKIIMKLMVLFILFYLIVN